MTADHLGIVELVDICARMRAVSLDLFGELGRWATEHQDTRRRQYATACHRHAWHAELWERRTPSIPGIDVDVVIAASRTTRLPTVPDELAYANELQALLVQLDGVGSRVDADLDPATARVVSLVRHDLAELLTA